MIFDTFLFFKISRSIQFYSNLFYLQKKIHLDGNSCQLEQVLLLIIWQKLMWYGFYKIFQWPLVEEESFIFQSVNWLDIGWIWFPCYRRPTFSEAKKCTCKIINVFTYKYVPHAFIIAIFAFVQSHSVFSCERFMIWWSY